MRTSEKNNGLIPTSSPAAPATVNRRAFLMRNAVIGAAAVMTGTDLDAEARAQQAAKEAAAAPS